LGRNTRGLLCPGLDRSVCSHLQEDKFPYKNNKLLQKAMVNHILEGRNGLDHENQQIVQNNMYQIN
jgi:hypothetical protein